MSEITENTFTAYLGPEFQLKLMWQILVEPEFAEKSLPNLAVEYFDDPNLKRLFIIVLEYFKEYGKVPNLQNQSVLQAINEFKTPNNKIEEESLSAVIKRIQLWNERVLNKQMIYDGDIVRKATNTFIKQQEYRKLGEQIIDKTKNGDIRNKNTINFIEEKFQKIAYIGNDDNDGTEIFEGIDKVLRKEFRETIPTGVDVIDALTGGGLGRGEIGVILTPSGVGKTTLLTKIANTGYECGKNVLQIIFEDTVEQIQRKHFAIWSKTALSKMDDNNEYVKEKITEKAVSMKDKSKLIIIRMSQENTTMVDVRNWITRYQKKYGIIFDELVLDYLDCLESHKKTSDRNEAELVIIKSFEALAGDLNIPGWTAIQTNRSGLNSEIVEAYQTGGSIKRLQKAHFFMSVAKTSDQKEANLANISIIKARFAKDGQLFEDCIFNNDTMEIIIEDTRYKFNKLKKVADEEYIDKIEDSASKLSAIHVALSNFEAEAKEKADNYIEPKELKTIADVKHDTEILLDESQEITPVETELQVETNVINSPPDSIGWTGESFTTIVNTEIPEVILEELPKIEADVVEEKPIVNLNTVINNKIGIEKKLSNTEFNNYMSGLIDPDEPQGHHKSVKDMLDKLRVNQSVVKKE